VRTFTTHGVPKRVCRCGGHSSAAWYTDFRAVAPQILIVGEHSRRAALLPRVEVLGYEVEECDSELLGPYLEERPAPATMVVCVPDIELPMFMARVRRNRASAAVPIVLCGRLGGVLGELTDVLDLGADHFLEEPIRDEPLRLALDALAGPGVSLRPARSWEGLEEAPTRIEPLVFKSVRPASGVQLGLNRPTATATANATPVAPPSPRSGGVPRWGAPASARLEVPATADANPTQPGGAPVSAAPVPAHAGLVPASAEAVPTRVEPRPSTVEPALAPVASQPSSAKPDLRDGDEASDEESGELDHPRRELPLPVQDRGSLRRIEVPRLLQVLRDREFHGRLELLRGRVRKDAWFDHGVFAFAQSNAPRERLAEGLRGTGKLTPAALEEARRFPGVSPVDEARHLIGAGWLKPDELGEVLVGHGRAVIAATFAWNRGDWVLHPDEPSPVGGAAARDIGLQRWVYAGVSECVEAAQLWSWLGGSGVFARLRSNVAATQWSELTSAWGLDSARTRAWLPLLSCVDRPLGALVDDESIDEPRAFLALVYTLSLAGVLELTHDAPIPAVVVPEEIDRVRIDAQLRLVRGADYFEILGLPRSARRTEVLRAYRGLSAAFSDPSLDPAARFVRARELTELRTGLDEARDVLADDTLRNAYLAHLHS